MIIKHAKIAVLTTREYPDGATAYSATVQVETSELTIPLTPDQYRIAKTILPHAAVMSIGLAEVP